ncbi:MAG: hypothetical protein FWD15_00130 [Alphaproteobacteria bacterium]|nr:hypothetical protein [Alphaproteobacteria bacterium]
MQEWILVNAWLCAAGWCAATLTLLLKKKLPGRLTVLTFGLVGTFALTLVCLMAAAAQNTELVAGGVLAALSTSAFAVALEFLRKVPDAAPVVVVGATADAKELQKLRKDTEAAINLLGENITDVAELLDRNHKKLAKNAKSAIEGSGE